MSTKKPARPRKPATGKRSPGSTATGRTEPAPVRRYKSAAEVLEDLLPALTSVVRAKRGRAKDGAWRALYLEALGSCANVTIAAKIAGVTRQAVFYARSDDEFAKAEKVAIDRGIDLVEASAFKSAVYGDLKPVYHQGILCGEVLEYSDAMRSLLLKGRRPEVYKDRQENSGTVNVVTTHMTRAEWKKRLADIDAAGA